MNLPGAGLFFIRERQRTCTSWFRVGGITDAFDSGYQAITLRGGRNFE